MTLELAISVCTLLIVVIAFLWGIYVYSRQMNAELFLEFTERYMTVMTSFSQACGEDCPIDIFETPPAANGRLTAATIRYLNLCSEEYYLYKRGFLSKHIWSIWEAEIKKTLRSELIRREWPVIRSAYLSFDEFQNFVDNELNIEQRKAIA